jgi:hypothetical protein
LVFRGSVGSAWSADGGAGGLVVAAGVDGEVANDFAGGGVDDADLEVVHEVQTSARKVIKIPIG